MNKISLIILLTFMQSCVMPGFLIDSNQLAQTPQTKNLEDIKKGIVVFRGISCAEEGNEAKEESDTKNIFARINKSFSECNAYIFRSASEDNYYIKQFPDSAGIKTYPETDYYSYTVPAGKYYYDFSESSKAESENAFYFEVREGRAFYAGDFIYSRLQKKFKVVDNYDNAKLMLKDKLPVPLEKTLAKGSKVIYIKN